MAGYDIIIIGSGLGGLLCGNILSREGYNVCVLERNHQAGGCLQTFRRGGSLFDTGMHYVGGLDQDQPVRRILNYLKIYDQLKLRRLDDSGYDMIRQEGKEYRLAMGYRQFVDQMSLQFPDHRESLMRYADKVREISETVDPFSNMGKNIQAEYLGFYSTSYDQYLRSLFGDGDPRNVFAGMSPLYAGIREKSPLYIPMMIHASYLNGAYRFVDGGSQLASILIRNIQENGGTVRTGTEVTRILTHHALASSAEINGSEIVESRYFISDIHPKNLIRLMDGKNFSPAYRKRINSLEETHGTFTVYLSSIPGGFRYENRNYYCYHNTDNLWETMDYDSETWPRGYMLHFSPVSSDSEHTNAIIMNAFMKWEDVMQWTGTRTGNRGADYEAFKQQKAEKLLFLLKQDFPEIHRAVTSWYTSTPLTYRDYTGTYEGSAYGILKDYNKPYNTMILPTTHISNLLLTGQNINTHGLVGVTIGALQTCSEIPGNRHLIQQICHG